jgi:Protein of unknown function (DUF2971)
MKLTTKLLLRRPRGRIFHYTSQAGLIGIVTNKCMWATSIHHLNDATEFDYARALMRDIITEKSLTEPNPKLVKLLVTDLDGMARVNIFVACFSEKSDLLSQWRAYCPNANGYSVGFSYSQLQKQMKAQGFFLVQCLYDPSEQKTLLRELVDEAFSAASGATSRQLDEIANDCIRKFLAVGPALKHPSFTEEAEWRLVSEWPKSIADSQIRVREGKSMLIPYFQFNLANEKGNLPEPQIVIGPTPHLELATLSTHFLMSSFAANVVPTTIPYRGW